REEARGAGEAVRPAVPGGARDRRLPRRVRPAQGGTRASTRPDRRDAGVGAAEPQRAQRPLPAEGPRPGVPRTVRGGVVGRVEARRGPTFWSAAVPAAAFGR